jgi:hypothetical protein
VSPTAATVLGRRQERARTSETTSLWTRPYARFLAVLTVLYVVGYGALIYAADGLPYVLDNNESFSTLLHATNLYEFGLSKSLGLTDEATGPNPAAHPYVHTHQGNFPRVFGFLIYVLGARTIESQIAVTTFTVGLVVVLLAYHVFARLAGPVLAFVVCLVLLSDYIHVAQWQVNTYRVWHFFLVFSSLTCAYGIGGRHQRLWLVLTVVNALVLFYCELVSVAFTSMLAGLFVVYLHWRRPRLVIAWTAAHTAGGLAALLILAIQLIAYLGWNDFVLDIWLTFSARNFGASDEAFAAMVRDFYEQNNILFWHNFVDGSRLRSLSAIVDVHARYVFQVYTPILTMIVLVLTSGWVLGLSWGAGSIWRTCREGSTDGRRAVVRFRSRWLYVNGFLEAGVPDLPPAERNRLVIANRAIRFGLLFIPLSVGLFSIVHGESVVGLTPATASAADLASSVLFSLLAGIGAAALLIRVSTGSWSAVDRLPIGRLCTAAVLLLGTSLVISQQPRAYDQAYRPIWYDPIAAIVPVWVDRIALLLALGLATSMSLFGTVRVLGASWASRLRGLAAYLVCAGIAYIITYELATGYVYSGYVRRSAPLPVFFTGVLVAFAACIVVAAAARAWRASARSMSGSRSVIAWGSRALGATAALLLVWMAGYWIVVNRTYATLLPPTQYAFVKLFASPPLHGSSAVVNNYHTPLSLMSGSWAYYDHDFGVENSVRQTPTGYMLSSNPIPRLWQADKLTNPDYARPDTFVCMRLRNFDSFAIPSSPPKDFDRSDCSALPLVERIERKRQRIVEHKLVARDPNTPATWAIVQLDWDFPPFLVNLDNGQSDELVRLVVTAGPANTAVQVQYQYFQQDGVSERGSTVRIHAAGADGRWCVYERSSNRTSFTLPADFRGTIRASVSPRSETKSGQETFGEPIVIGDGQGAPCVGR